MSAGPLSIEGQMLEIRRYHPEDNSAVKALHYAGLEQFGVTADPYHDDDLDDIEGRYLDGGDFLVGVEGNEIVVIGAVRRVTDTLGEIKRIRVRRNLQRRGYGEIILYRLIARAAELDYSELCLDTLASNTPAQRFFAKHGFIETHRGMIGPHELVFYKKQL